VNDFFRIEGLSKNFGKLMALFDISFSVKQGEVVGLIGPNGAGKTTFFNVVTGFYRPSSGKIIFKDKDVTNAPPNKLASMGMVRTFQIPRPFKELTVTENVAVATLFNPRLKCPSKELLKRILTGLDLYPWKDQQATTLGYGTLKRLELGRSQGASPELLLLDEPFSGLNASEIEKESRILRSLVEEGITFIIVEHKLRELMKLVDRIIVLNFGIKIADGTPETITKDKQVLEAYLGRRWGGNSPGDKTFNSTV
jgi:ABC-type branched-subunit amino acid transport system ATPase component